MPDPLVLGRIAGLSTVQSFKLVVKNSLLFVRRVHHITDRESEKRTCFSE